jgi:hypothetical protein
MCFGHKPAIANQPANQRQPACKSTPTGLQINANRPMGVQKVDI